MNKYYISVIIPAYNAEKYINRCLDSIVSQTIFKKIEAIVVNDGSTDATKQKVSAYLNYDNFKLINMENSGVSKARNKGIEEANGKYITFVDADDWVEENCYEKMYEAAMSTDSDIVAAGIIISDDTKDIVTRSLVNNAKIENQEEAIKDFYKENIDVHVVNKIFRKNILNNIRFNAEIKVAEDRLFLCDAIFNALKVYLLNTAFYHYYQNPNSVMHQMLSEKKIEDDVYVHKYMIEKCYMQYSNIVPYAYAMYISMLCRMCGDMYSSGNKSKVFDDLYENVKKYSFIQAWKYMSFKHRIALLLIKIDPRLFIVFRKSTYLKYKK